MKRTVFALQDGDYSDYHVIGIYTTRSKAKVVQSKFGGTIDEWPIDPGYHAINAGLTTWLVLMLRDGTTEHIERWDVSGYDLAGSCKLWRRSKALFYKGTNTPDCLDATVWAKDEKHAIKIVNENRTQMIADGKW